MPSCSGSANERAIEFCTKELDLDKLASEFDDKLVALKHHWAAIIDKNTDAGSVQSHFRIGLVWLGYTYARLVALSFGLQHLSGQNRLEDNPFVTRVCTNLSESSKPYD